ncbi:MAG: hypothetical protein OXC61_10880 [Flavobacteriaceae bacterium]|nr:hypothetical protein [Flavobacteriaceae bacterium]
MDFLQSFESGHLTVKLASQITKGLFDHPAFFSDGFVSLFLWLGSGLVVITLFHFSITKDSLSMASKGWSFSFDWSP